jgi:hypothetical protein
MAQGMERAGASLERIGARQKAVDRTTRTRPPLSNSRKVKAELDKAEIDGRDQAGQAAPAIARRSARSPTIGSRKALGAIKDPRIRSRLSGALCGAPRRRR